MGVVFNSGTKGIRDVLVSCACDSTGAFSGNASNANGYEIQFYGDLAAFSTINNNNTLNNWDLTIADQDKVQIFTNTSVSSNNAMFIPDKAGVTGTTQYHVFPVSGALSITIANVSADATPKIRFYFKQ